MGRPVRSLTSREFDQGTGAALRAALAGPVFITDRGRPSHVLLSNEHYRELVPEELVPERRSIVDLLCRTPGIGDIDFEVPRRDDLGRAAVLD